MPIWVAFGLISAAEYAFAFYVGCKPFLIVRWIATGLLMAFIVYVFTSQRLRHLYSAYDELRNAHLKQFVSRRLAMKIGGPLAAAVLKMSSTSPDGGDEINIIDDAGPFLSEASEAIPLAGDAISVVLGIRRYILDEERQFIRDEILKSLKPAVLAIGVLFILWAIPGEDITTECRRGMWAQEHGYGTKWK